MLCLFKKSSKDKTGSYSPNEYNISGGKASEGQDLSEVREAWSNQRWIAWLCQGKSSNFPEYVREANECVNESSAVDVD